MLQVVFGEVARVLGPDLAIAGVRDVRVGARDVVDDLGGRHGGEVDGAAALAVSDTIEQLICGYALPNGHDSVGVLFHGHGTPFLGCREKL